MSRISRDDLFMDMAEDVAERGTCLRLKAGCIIVGMGVISMGYNSSSSGTKHCSEIGCLLDDDHCIRCLHAEEAAIMKFPFKQVTPMFAYVTHTPCVRCYKLLADIGVTQIFVKYSYGKVSESYNQLIMEIGVPLIWKTA